MDGRILLDVRILADLDGLEVAADDGAEPHAHTLFDRDVAGDVTIEEGVSVWFGAVVRGDFQPIKIGKNTNI